MNHHSEQQLKALSNKVKDHQMRKRLLAVAHFKVGKNRAEVARSLNVSRRMVNEWVAKYLKGGTSVLESKKHRLTLFVNGAAKVSADRLHGETEPLLKRTYLNGDMLQIYIHQTFAVNYHQNSIYNLLKSLSISWTASRSKDLKQSEEAQENLKKRQIVTIKSIPGHIALDKADFWFKDEVRISQQNTTTRL